MNSNKSEISLLWLIAGILLVAGAILMDPARLEQIGAFRKSLASDLPGVRDWALLEIALLRVAGVAIGIAIALLSLAWPFLKQSKLVERWNLLLDRLPMREYELNGSQNMAAAIGVALVIAVAYIVYGGHIVPADMLEFINREDGAVEQLSFVFCIVSGIFIFQSIKFIDDSLQRVSLAAFGMLFILMGMEEISWGQRIFLFETPETVKSFNVQGEVNLHNSFGYAADHLFILGVIIYGFVLPLMAARYQIIQRLTGAFALPLAPLSLALAFFLVSLIHDWSVTAILPNTSGVRIAEVRELLTLMALAAVMYLNLRFLRERAAATSEAACADQAFNKV